MLLNKYFLKTIFDVGFIRIIGRLKYEIKKIIFGFLPGKLNLFISNAFQKNPNFKDVLGNLKKDKLFVKNNLN